MVRGGEPENRRSEVKTERNEGERGQPLQPPFPQPAAGAAELPDPPQLGLIAQRGRVR